MSKPDWRIDHRGDLVACAKQLRKVATLDEAVTMLAEVLKANRAPSSVSAQAVTGWQPIETAPRDGSWFWVKRVNDGSRPFSIQETAFKWDANYKGWFAGSGWWGSRGLEEMKFTHWFPMPLPPSTDSHTENPS